MRVLVLEASRRVGGRAFSFVHRGSGQRLDNGVHVLLGLCGQFQALLDTAGLGEAVRYQPLLEVPVMAREGRATFRSARLNGPFHLLGSLASYSLLRPAERARALWAGIRIERMNDVADWDRATWAEWLRQAGQSERAQRYLWEAIGTGVFNARANELSAALALKTFRLLFDGGWRGGRIGLFQWPLQAVSEAFCRYLAARGVDIRLGERVTALDVRANRIVAVCGSERHAVPQVVLALPPKRLREVVDRSGIGHQVPVPPFSMSPIVNVYLFYDRSVWPHDLMLLPDEWGAMVFNRTRLVQPDEDRGDILAVSISAASALRGKEASFMAQEVIRGVRDRLGLPEPVSIQVVWQPEATFLAVPGTEAQRPGPTTPVEGLVLAGDWTGTDWPACLEGAVLSGRRAAETCVAGDASRAVAFG